MNILQNGFYDKIKEKYPHWNETEFRVFCLTCEPQFDDTIIAVVLDTTIPMVRKIRNKVRKDMGIPKYDHNFIAFLEQDLKIKE
jgi:hypothetical protein